MTWLLQCSSSVATRRDRLCGKCVEYVEYVEMRECEGGFCLVNLLWIDRGIKKRNFVPFLYQHQRSHTCQCLMFPQFVIQCLVQAESVFVRV